MTVVDTSAMIDYLIDGPLAERVERLIAERTAALSAIVVFELLAGVRDELHLANRRELIDLVTILPVTREIAERSAELFTALRRRGVTVDNEDVIVAATAMSVPGPVLTANRKHFEPIDGLSLA